MMGEKKEKKNRFFFNTCFMDRQQPIELLGQAPFTGLPNEHQNRGQNIYNTMEPRTFFFLGFMLVNFWIVCNLPYLFPTKFLNR